MQEILDSGATEAGLDDVRSPDTSMPLYPVAKERKPMDAKLAEENQDRTNRFIAPKLTAMDVREDEYTSLGALSDVDGAVNANSGGWTSEFFRSSMGPHSVVPVSKVRFHLDVDLLRCDYVVDKFAITTVETIAFAIVIVNYDKSEQLLRLRPSEQLAEVNRVGASLFNLPDFFRSRRPSSVDESLAFSTDPGVYVMTMNSWRDRVDAGVYKGQLYFLFHKKIAQLMGFSGNKGWFGKEFREKYAPKRP